MNTRLIAPLLAACSVAASASAQCDFTRTGIPDFDQRRDALPADGGMYCVPTSAVNWMGYVANRGVPTALGGPRNWQSQLNYDFVTSRINLMGAFMDTDPQDGTYGDPGLQGLRAYVSLFAPGKFTVTYYYGDYSVFPLTFHWVLGNLVNVCYGYYPVNAQGRYSRNGGHCITLNGIFDACDSTYALRWRDPASDNKDLDAQSTFASKVSDASSQFFVDTDGDLHSRIRLWDLGVDSTTRRYLDCFFSINPLVVLSGGSILDNLHIHRPVQVLGVTPPSQQATIPGLDSIIQVELDAQQLNAFIVTSQIIPRQQTVWRRNLATGETTEVISVNTSLKIATGRHGHLFVMGDGSVRKYRVGDQATPLLQSIETSLVASALTYDDARDELVGVTTTDRLIRFPNDLSGIINEPLPAAVEADGSVSIAIDEDLQRYYICGTASPNISVVELIPGSPRLRINSVLLLPAVQAPDDLQFTDEETLAVIDDGQVAEFEQTAAGGWQARMGSSLTGLPAFRALAVARSRSNFIAGVHDTPAWNNRILNEGVADVPDCDADFNQDGVLNSQDFFDFLTAFFAGAPTADFNADAAINSQDFFDFLTAFFAGCRN
jgi:hypothetical protein